MTVHVIIPVFNRLHSTQSIIECLRNQVLDEPLSITVVDDGSTDGTNIYLQNQSDVITLQGDGKLWWGGAINMALGSILARSCTSDWVLFVNNDTQIAPNFVLSLIKIARTHAPAAVGSIVRNIQPPHKLLSIGPRIDYRILSVREIRDNEIEDVAPGVTSADALSGRGVLYPVAALWQVKGMRHHWLPHYLADYELSLRVKGAGWSLIISHAACVYSFEEYGSSRQSSNLYVRFFSLSSPYYLPAQLRFWWQASSIGAKITFPFQLLLSYVRKRLQSEIK